MRKTQIEHLNEAAQGEGFHCFDEAMQHAGTTALERLACNAMESYSKTLLERLEDNMKFEFVADKGVADAIDKFGKSHVLMKLRSFSIGKITHFDGYSTVDIIANEGGIKPGDLVWLGWFAKGIEQGII